MKALLAMTLLVLPVFCQPEVGTPMEQVLNYKGDVFESSNPRNDKEYAVLYQFSVGANGTKILNYNVCRYSRSDAEYVILLKALALNGSAPVCLPINQSKAETFSFVQSLESAVRTWAAEEQTTYKINYGTLAEPVRPALSTVAPSPPPNPFLVFADGLGGNVMKFDLTAGSVVAQVQPPATAIGPVGLRPGAAGSTNEVWVVNETPQITVVDLGAQSVLANIPTPSLPNSVAPVGIVFTNSGNTAFEAVKYYSPDSSGNNGALVVFDAVNRMVKSTFPLRYAPAAMIMAPDALTIYLLSTRGQLAYYDVLSGTADLSVSTYTPGSNGGYPGTSNAFVHPDGTRLFWNVGTYLTVFDLTSRKVIAQFNSGLPTTSAVTLEVSQDGSTATMSNGAGMVVVLDTRYGIVQATSQNATATLAFPGN